MAVGCSRFRPDLSAFADGTLSSKRWEQVCYHLAGCQDCRDEVAAISRVCSTLSSARTTAAPHAWAAKLEGIAGEHAEAPLYMAKGDGELPSSRRRRTRLAAQGSAALVAVMASVVVLAILIAPDPRRVTDPVGEAREQYSMSSSAININEAVGAVLLAYERGAQLGESVEYESRQLAQGRVVAPERAAELLLTAAQTDLSLSGIQRVWVSDGAGAFHTAEVHTQKVAGQGAQLEVFDARGTRFMSSFLPEFAAPSVRAPRSWEFHETLVANRHHDGRSVQLVAVDDTGPAAAWWFDENTGLLLWSERYDCSGAPTIAVGYTDLDLGSAEFDEGSLSQLIALQPATAHDAADWCRGLPRCPQEIAGLPLVAYSSSNRDADESINLVYSDGFETAVVGWSEGLIADGVTSRTDRSAGLPTVALWQWGPSVVSVTTNGSPQLVEDFRAALPRQEPYAPTLSDRIAAGLGRLMAIS